MQLALILDRLLGYYPKGIDLSLDRIERFLEDLGNPHLSLPPVIHVAGTNGKGSVVAMLRAFFESAGARCHVYTSPHLVRFHERIRLAGKLISDAELLAVLTECESVNAGRPVTFFEITTAAAFLAFSRIPADVVLLETGMGGRLDATTVVPAPCVSVITRISLDHKDYLGDTIAAIATEKAGIMKPRVPCIIGVQSPEDASIKRVVQDVFDRCAAERGAPLFCAGRDWHVRANPENPAGTFLFETSPEWGDVRLTLPRPVLPGEHQIENAGCALAALWAARRGAQGGLACMETDILSRALGAISWPARLQCLTEEGGQANPLAAFLPRDASLWLDGGHNDSAGLALARQAKSWAREDARPLHLVMGMLRTKDPKAFLSPLLPFAESLTAIPVHGDPLSLPPEEIIAIARALSVTDAKPPVLNVAADVPQALEALRHRVDGGALAGRRVLICGSLYLAGHILSMMPDQTALWNAPRPAHP